MARVERTRRRFLQLAGSGAVISIAGCLGGGDGGAQETETTEETTTTTTEEGAMEHEEELPEGVSEEEFEKGPVPEPYRTAESQAGEPREAELFPKADVQFQEAEAAVEAGLTEAGHNCGNCAEYIPDKNGDGFGACAKVEGYIGTDDWCSLWESIEEAEEGDENGSEIVYGYRYS